MKEKGISQYVFGQEEDSQLPLFSRLMFHNEINDEIYVSTMSIPANVLTKWGQEHQGEDMAAIQHEGHCYISLSKCQEIHPEGAVMLAMLEKGLREKIKELTKIHWYGDGQGVVEH